MNEDSAVCQVRCSDSESLPVCVDRQFDDFDAQSEQLTGHDQDYVQMSAGPFRGRFISVFPGDGVSLHLETANRSLAQRVGCPRELISLGLVLDRGPPFIANGARLDQDSVLITKPGRELSLNSPAGGSILAICIERSALERAISPNAPRHLDPDHGDISVVHAPGLAAQVRTGATNLFRALRNTSGEHPRHRTASLLVAAIAAAFDLHTAIGASCNREDLRNSFRTFLEARDAMSAHSMTEFDYAALCAATRRGPRSIQAAFARHARATRLRKFRALKLARVRRTLLADQDQAASIGDIAAAGGFWSWSRFTQIYRSQFGELPSETRTRAAAEHREARAKL